MKKNAIAFAEKKREEYLMNKVMKKNAIAFTEKKREEYLMKKNAIAFTEKKREENPMNKVITLLINYLITTTRCYDIPSCFCCFVLFTFKLIRSIIKINCVFVIFNNNTFHSVCKASQLF